MRSSLKKFTVKIDSFILGALIGTIVSTLLIFVGKYVQYDEYMMSTTRTLTADNYFVTKESNIGDVTHYVNENVKVLCWVLTMPENHAYKATSINATWGSRCDKLIFISTDYYDGLDIVKVNVTEDRVMLWGKTKRALEYLHENHLNDYDWFLKADDDTFVIIENLKYLLYSYSTDMPIYFGCKLKPFVKQGYMSGGAGYVLSREALKRVFDVLPNPNSCKPSDDGSEDVEIGICLENAGVLAGDSRDEKERGRFFPFPPEGHFRQVFVENWFENSTFYKVQEGYECCSELAISFHYLNTSQMYHFNYLIYHLKLFGLQRSVQTLPKKFTIEEVRAHLDQSNNKNEMTTLS